MPFVMLRFRRSSVVTTLWMGALGWLVLFAPSCLRTLDESLIPSGGHGGQAGSPEAGGGDSAGGSSGSAGSSGMEGGPDVQVDAPRDAFPEGNFTPYDATKHPLTALYCQSPSAPLVIATDDTSVYHIPRGVQGGDPTDVLAGTPLDGSSGFLLDDNGDIPKPQAMAVAPNVSSFVYIAAGSVGGADVGSLLRLPTSGDNSAVSISSDPIELAVGIFADTNSSDKYAYVSSQAQVSGLTPAVLRFGLGSGSTADTVYDSTAGNESGGEITASSGCVYWVSNGAIWTISEAATDSEQRKSALTQQVSDAVALTSDSTNIYYTRASGQVWQKALTTGCDGSTSAPEKLIARGYTGIGGIVAYGGTVAWAVKGDSTQNYLGGGIFTTPTGGYDVTQIAPNTDKNAKPVSIDQITNNTTDVVYSTSAGCIFEVPE
jgi:hypothetical protein